MKPLRIYWLMHSSYVTKVFQISYGFSDRCLLWVVNGRLYDFLFIKIIA